MLKRLNVHPAFIMMRCIFVEVVPRTHCVLLVAAVVVYKGAVCTALVGRSSPYHMSTVFGMLLCVALSWL